MGSSKELGAKKFLAVGGRRNLQRQNLIHIFQSACIFGGATHKNFSHWAYIDGKILTNIFEYNRVPDF